MVSKVAVVAGFYDGLALKGGALEAELEHSREGEGCKFLFFNSSAFNK